MTDSPARQWVCARLSELSGEVPAAVRLDCGLDAYGMDSVDALALAGEIEEAFGIEIDPATFLRFASIAEMIRSLERQLRRR